MYFLIGLMKKFDGSGNQLPLMERDYLDVDLTSGKSGKNRVGSSGWL